MRLSKENVQKLKDMLHNDNIMKVPVIAVNNLIETIEALQQEVEQLKADLRGKDNEINDLKALVEYLRKFKPKRDEAVREGSV